MATVRDFKVKPGEMFGGKGAAVFRPFKRTQSHSEKDGLSPEEQLALKVERAIMQVTIESQPPSTENPKKTP